MRTLLTGGRIIDPANQVDAQLTLGIEGDKIVFLGKSQDFTADRIIDLSGQIICPGLVDLCARVQKSSDGDISNMDVETHAARNAGITTISCPPDTNPITDTPAMAQLLIQRSQRNGNTRVFPQGAMTVALQGRQITNMHSLAEAGCVGISNAAMKIDSTLLLRRAMQYAANFDLTVFLDAQDHSLQGNGCVHEGIVSARLGLPAIPEAAETVAVARDLALIETTGVKAHFCHLSSARSIDMIEHARATGLAVSCDVTAHHLHLCDEDIGYFDTDCHVRPPLRSRRDRDALRSGIKSGSIAVICSDHQPQSKDAKSMPFNESAPGISGLTTLLPLTMQLVDEGVLNLSEAITALTTAPAKILGIAGGDLSIGTCADICIIDPNQQWRLTEKEILSSGKNTPFLGESFGYRVSRCFINGVDQDIAANN